MLEPYYKPGKYYPFFDGKKVGAWAAMDENGKYLKNSKGNLVAETMIDGYVARMDEKTGKMVSTKPQGTEPNTNSDTSHQAPAP